MDHYLCRHQLHHHQYPDPDNWEPRRHPYHRLLDQAAEANERFQVIGGQTMQGDTEKVLMGLGFKRSDFIRQVAEFSSGWQMRLELAKILLKKPDVVLLDDGINI